MKASNITLGQDLIKLIAEIDEFKGRWDALKTLSPDRLNALRKVATVESVGSSTRIEGAKLTDAEVEQLLSNIKMQSFHTRDEQESLDMPKQWIWFFRLTRTSPHRKPYWPVASDITPAQREGSAPPGQLQNVAQ
jgi:hypothetical protein